MFRQWARTLKHPNTDGKATEEEKQNYPFETIFTQHPQTIAEQVELTWRDRFLPSVADAPFPSNLNVREKANSLVPIPFEHLIYAYMIENTRVYDIFRRVVFEMLHGEKLDTPIDVTAQRWLRTTEELFYRDTPSFHSFTITSQVRTDNNATRRNAYFRMFGMDLNHGTDDNKPYPYHKPLNANREFIPTLERLLVEVWEGISNANNSSGPRSTDDDMIATLCRQLMDMLNARRQQGNLSREEYWATTMMAWFHLTLEENTPIVKSLRAESTSPFERLRKIGERVSLHPHGKSEAFFLLADQLSIFLRDIEAGKFNDVVTARLLYLAPPVRDTVLKVINQYSIATGRDIKAKKVALKTR